MQSLGSLDGSVEIFSQSLDVFLVQIFYKDLVVDGVHGGVHLGGVGNENPDPLFKSSSIAEILNIFPCSFNLT